MNDKPLFTVADLILSDTQDFCQIAHMYEEAIFSDMATPRYSQNDYMTSTGIWLRVVEGGVK